MIKLTDFPTLLQKPRRGAAIIDRIRWKIVEYNGNLQTPCWFWTGSCSTGYGQLSVTTVGKRRMIYVHRWLYERYVGPIPSGHVLHHKCETPHCVNPAHLEPMTQQWNVRQFTNKKTHCKQGHLLSPDNVYMTPRGTRVCRKCGRDTQRRRGMLALRNKNADSPKYMRLPRGTPVLERIMAKITEYDGPLESNCWIWMGSLCGPGYGQIRITEGGKSRRVMVHRWMFQHHYGKPPQGMEVHHKCDTARCINPAHLELVTHQENILRTTEKLTHCKNGHPLSGSNVRVTSDGRRLCKACKYANVRKITLRRDKTRKRTLDSLKG